MTEARWPDETREMRLVTKVIELSDAVSESSLPEFIAVRRQPESNRWSTWDEITIDLHAVTGEVITDVSLRRWAHRYGIPETSGGLVTRAEYAKAMRQNHIKI